jgi:hypothetical protein
MPGFTNLLRKKRPLTRRSYQRDIMPTAIKTAQLAFDVIKNTSAAQEDAVTLNNGAQLTATSTIASTINPDIRIATVPFMIAMFQDSLSAANHIPYGSSVDDNVYDFIAPTAVPQITTIGTDGNNVVYKTALYNGTGSSQSIIIVTQARFITGIGGSAS